MELLIPLSTDGDPLYRQVAPGDSIRCVAPGRAHPVHPRCCRSIGRFTDHRGARLRAIVRRRLCGGPRRVGNLRSRKFGIERQPTFGNCGQVPVVAPWSGRRGGRIQSGFSLSNRGRSGPLRVRLREKLPRDFPVRDVTPGAPPQRAQGFGPGLRLRTRKRQFRFAGCHLRASTPVSRRGLRPVATGWRERFAAGARSDCAGVDPTWRSDSHRGSARGGSASGAHIERSRWLGSSRAAKIGTTGAILPLARRLGLLQWAERASGVVAEDDYDDPASLVLYGACQATSRLHAQSRKG